jgi:hypothetical protein
LPQKLPTQQHPFPNRLGFLVRLPCQRFRLDGFRVVIYPNDHSPAHVHVIGATAEAVFELHCAKGPVTLRESYSFKTKELRRLMKELDARLSLLCDECERIHDAD